MRDSAGPAHYSMVARVLHWSVVALIVIQFAIAWTMPDIHGGMRPVGLIGWHLSFGTAILAVMLVRLVWRLSHREPVAPETISAPLRRISRGTHALLYALLVALPLLGWANASARGWPVRLFGAIPLPPLSATGSPLGLWLGDVHGTVAIVLLAVIALHVAGALYHLLILRDRTVQRML
ncbi:cytochrome b [Sphingomonas sp. PAMC 26617]|uniref:cytochrome b n=1 Tax=Sphingomonas sp. PAMC 26617 TaxID=1112216 RepID=UPI001E61ED7E|nr:cytochrome b/b6 domain-containing protein [Sphingomonas sp. PAMC 26617]